MDKVVEFALRRHNVKKRELLGHEVTPNNEVHIFTSKGTIIYQNITKSYFLEPDCNRTVGRNIYGHRLPPSE